MTPSEMNFRRYSILKALRKIQFRKITGENISNA